MLRALCLAVALFGCAGAARPPAPAAPVAPAPAGPLTSVACDGPNCMSAPNIQAPCEGPGCGAPTSSCEGINCPPPAQAGAVCPKDAKADDPRCATGKPMLELK